MKTQRKSILARPLTMIRQLFDGSQRRFRLSRPGSVLILCIALLVLLALIGTAMISTAGIDRYASVQHTYNTQIDLLVEGVENMAQGWINGGLYQAQTTNVPATLFRPADQDVDQQVSNYVKYDAVTPGALPVPAAAGAAAPPLPSQELWLAPRVPQLSNPAAPPASPANPPLWRTLTMPLAPQMIAGYPVYQYESPYNSSSLATAQSPIPLTTQVRDGGVPTFITATSGTIYPALNMTGAGSFMAADTDGDGIADALYFKLCKVGDITYYAAARIIDNNSAINANTAWSRDYDFTNDTTGNGGFNRTNNPNGAMAGTKNYGFFRSNVGFMEMFPDYAAGGVFPAGGGALTNPGTSAQMNTGLQSINGYRFNGRNAAADPYDAANPPSPHVYYLDPTTGNATYRSDFVYSSQGDGLEFGLASRLDNPNYNFYQPDDGAPSAGSTPRKFQAFSSADTAALVSRFAILNPSASTSELENDAYNALMQLWKTAGGSVSIVSTPYQAQGTLGVNDSIAWYNQNFDYDSAIPADNAPTPYRRMPLRPILVTRDPVSNLAPVPHGPYDYNGDGVGAVVFAPNYQGAGGNDPLIPPYLTITSPSGSAGDWGWSNAPTARLGMASYTLATGGVAINAKTNINTAPFEQLWRAFWSVMADVKVSNIPAPNNTKMGDNPPADGGDGCIFRSPSRDPRPYPVSQVNPPIGQGYGALNTGQFRPTPPQMMQIRSALAAVNAIDLRDGDDDVTSREIPVFDTNAAAAPTLKFRVRVFGNERQPFITKVFVSNYDGPKDHIDVPNSSSPTNPKGYVAIELYNPYNTPMQLNRWAVGIINRQGTATANSYQKPSNLTATDGLHITRLSARTPAMPTASFDEHYLNQLNRLTGATTKAQVVIPARGYALLENYPGSALSGAVGASTSDATYRPDAVFQSAQLDTLGSGTTPTMAYVYVPNLSDVMQATGNAYTGGELVLLRPRRADGALTSSISPNNTYHEVMSDTVTPNLADWVPIDAFDFSGLEQITTWDASGVIFDDWYYARDNSDPWKFVFPGPYDVTKGIAGMPAGLPRLTATRDASYSSKNTDQSLVVKFGSTNSGTGPTPSFAGIQLQNQDWGLNSPYIRWPALAGSTILPCGFPAQYDTTGNTKYKYPFGGFARNGDMLMVPFIGAYQVLDAFANGQSGFNDANYTTDPTVPAPAPQTPNPSPFWEFTPITMDCSFADDCQRTKPSVTGQSSTTAIASDAPGTSDDADEQVGRFCPIEDSAVQDLKFADQPTNISPYTTAGAPSAAGTVYWKYHFATRLFDYLTVQSPNDDYLPMADPNARDSTVSSPAPFLFVAPNAVPAVPIPTATNYPDPTGSPTPTLVKYPSAATPLAVQNSVSTTPAADHRITSTIGKENRLAVDGLININTAPWYVLAQLPLLPPSSAGTPPNANGIPPNIEALAKAIVSYRETGNNGQPAPFTTLFDLNGLFTSATMTPAQATVASSGTDWDISPNGTQVTGDFEQKYLLMTRISNLVTTRSDTFTVFIVVDGFRNAGTNDPQLVVHRRAATIIDRSGLTPEKGSTSGQMNVATQ